MLSGEWTAALSDYERAAVLDPHGQVGKDAKGNALLLKGEMSGQLGDFLDWSRLRLEWSPLDVTLLSDLAWAQHLAGHPDASAATFVRLLEVNPNFSAARAVYGLTLLLMGKNIEALAAAEMEPDDAYKLAALTNIYWALGRRADPIWLSVRSSKDMQIVRRMKSLQRTPIAARQLPHSHGSTEPINNEGARSNS